MPIRPPMPSLPHARSPRPALAGVVGIPAIAYAFAGEPVPLAALAARGALASTPELLASFGFDAVHVAAGETPYELALAASRALLEEHRIDPASVDAIVYGGTTAAMAFAAADDARDAALALCTTGRFRYPAARLQYDLGMERAALLGVDQLACTTLFGAVRVARALCLAEGMQRVLCVASEFFPSAAGREALWNCTSDAACAILVERGADRHRVHALTTVSKGYYWDADAMPEEVVASYFPTAQHVVRRTLDAAGWRAADVRWVFPHNVSARSWRILMGLLALPNATLWDANIAARGHTLAGDNFINLRDAVDAGALRPGEKALLFSYGFGAHWTALALEV